MIAAAKREFLWLYGGLLVLAGALAYSGSFSAPFVFDGGHYIKDNPSLGFLWPWHYTLGLNRPLGFFTFALNYVCHGTQVWGYHAVSLAVHLTAGLVLFGLVRRTLARPPLASRYAFAADALAFCVALIWLVHPLQTESVTYVYQRLESLMGLFYLLTLYGFVRAQQSRHPVAWYALSVVCCAAGMGTKEVMITAPVLVLWYDRAFVATSWRELFGRRWRYYAALASTWAILAVLMAKNFLVSKQHGVLVVENVTPSGYALSQSVAILHYLKLAIWPADQCLDYAWLPVTDPWQIIPAVCTILLLVALTIWAIWRYPGWGFVSACFFVVLSPTSSVAPTADIAVEHRMYLPLTAVVIVAVIGGFELIRRLSTPAWWSVGWLAVLLAAVCLGSATHAHNRLYCDESALWLDVVEKSPGNARAWIQLGNVRLNAGDPLDAIRMYDKSLALLYQYVPAPVYFSDAYMARGNAHSQLAQFDQAVSDYSEAIRFLPENSKAHYNRAVSLAQMGKPIESLKDYDRAIELDPAYIHALANRATINQALNRFAKSLQDFNRAIELAPDNALLYTSRALLLAAAPQADLRNGKQAVADATRACELSGWRLAPALVALAAAQAEAGDFEQAVRRQQQALELAKDDRQFQQAARAQLQLYRAGKPFRFSP